MKITETRLRGIIREAIESQSYKDLNKRISQKGKIVRSVKDFSKIVIDQVETLVNGIDVPFDPIEKRFDAFVILKNEVSDHFKEIEKEYNKKIREPKNKADAERAKLARKSLPTIDEDQLSPESERYYMDHD